MIGPRITSLGGIRVGPATVGEDELAPDYGRLLIAIMGQSNAEGQANTADLTDGSIATIYPNVSLWSWAATVSPYAVNYDLGPQSLQPRPYNSPTPNMGSELTLGRYLDAIRHSFGIVKVAIGNTNLEVHWDPTGTYPQASPNLFQFAVQRCKDAEAQMGGKLSAIVWIQGEADAGTLSYANDYAANLTAMIAAWRVYWPNIPFIIAELNALNGGTYVSTVRAAQVSVTGSVPYSYLVSMDDLPQTLHYTADQLAAMGGSSHLGPWVANAISLWLSPTASFSHVPTGLSVAFTDTSTDPNKISGGIASWAWDFGDGNTSTSQDPTHVFGNNGTYTVQLTVTNNHGKTSHTQTSITVAAPTWTSDATSGKAVPASSTEWTSFISGNGLSNWSAPDHLYLLQESSGNAADSIASLTLTASTAGSAPLYQQTLNGWARKGVGGSQVSSQKFATTSSPNATTSSCLALLIVGFGTLDATTRGLFTNGASFSDSGLSVYLNASPSVDRVRLRGTGGLFDTATTSTYNATGRPMVFRHDITNSVTRLYTDQEKISSTYSAGTSAANMGLGAVGGGTFANAIVGYLVIWYGTDAERSDADVKALLTAMGYSIPWS